MLFIDFLFGQRHIYVMTNAGFLQLLVTHNPFQIQFRKKETHMFSVASVITLSVFSELLWKSNSLVHHKFN